MVAGGEPGSLPERGPYRQGFGSTPEGPSGLESGPVAGESGGDLARPVGWGSLEWRTAGFARHQVHYPRAFFSEITVWALR